MTAAVIALGGSAMRDEERRREDEQLEHRQTMSRADATVVLVDRQLERLNRAAQMYKERLEGTRRGAR